MTSVYIGFQAYVNHKGEIKAIPALVGDVPAEIEDGDLIYTIEKDGQSKQFCAGQTAVEVSDRSSPIEGDEQWIQLMTAALNQGSKERIEQLAVGLTITAWDEHAEIRSRLSGSWGIKSIEGQYLEVNPERLELYPAITAALYDLHLQLVDGELFKKNEELLEGRPILLILVGNRHTEWILANGLQVLKGGVLYSGISTVQLEIRDYYYHQTGLSLLPADADAALIMQDVEIDGKYVPVDKQISTGEAKLAAALEVDIKRLQHETGVEEVFLAGEGLRYVEQHAIKRLGELGVRIADDPEHAVIRGLEVLLRLTGDRP